MLRKPHALKKRPWNLGLYAPQQADHIDQDEPDSAVVLANMDIKDGYLGVVENSAQAVRGLREFADMYYDGVLNELESAKSPSDQSQRLIDAMAPGTLAEKQAMVWDLVCQNHFPRFYLQKFGQHYVHCPATAWYIKIPKYHFVLMSTDVVHFGARYPVSGAAKSLTQHFRLHIYLTASMKVQIQAGSVEVESQDAQYHTVNLRRSSRLHPVIRLMGWLAVNDAVARERPF